jgi:hypothetical protein
MQVWFLSHSPFYTNLPIGDILIADLGHWPVVPDIEQFRGCEKSFGIDLACRLRYNRWEWIPYLLYTMLSMVVPHWMDELRNRINRGSRGTWLSGVPLSTSKMSTGFVWWWWKWDVGLPWTWNDVLNCDLAIFVKRLSRILLSFVWLCWPWWCRGEAPTLLGLSNL